MNKNEFQPAFPTWIQNDSMMPGMTLRDYFAAQVIQGYYSNHNYNEIDHIDLARWSYSAADAMMEARK
jgi:hypothetical protein